MSETRRIDRLRAAIAETEELARRALNGPFVGMRAGVFTDHHEAMPNPSRVVKVSILPMGWDEGPWAPIYVAFDPEVALRRCTADRKLVDMCEREILAMHDNAEAEARAWLMLDVYQLMIEAYGVTGE